MTLDASKVGVAAAQLMEDLETEQAEAGDQQTIGEVMLLAEVRGEDENGAYTYIRFRSTDDRNWVQRGMLHAALELEYAPDLNEDDED